MMKVDDKKNFIFAIVMFVSIFTICSTTSFLYPFCDESHCFFNVGKAILNGRVLYKDILEQKGLLIYIIQIPAYLISHTNFFGVWLVQLFFMIPSAIAIYKIANFYLKSSFKSLLATSLCALIIFTSKALASGQIVEVYTLPFFLYSLYWAIKYTNEKELVPDYKIFINGLFAGVIFWMKYSLVGFYFGYMAYICIRLLLEKKIKEAFKKGFIFMGGFLVISMPCILYFVFNDATKELINYYFLNNIAGYGAKITLISMIKVYIDSFVLQFNWNLLLMVTLLLGIIYLLRKMKFKDSLFILIIFLVQYGIIFSHGGMYSYYLFAFAGFTIFGCIAVLDGKFLYTKALPWYIVYTICLLFIVLAIIFKPQPNQFLKKTDKLAQYQFADYMNSHYKKPTLLDLDLDGGFYTVADIVPNTWAYCRLNWNSSKMIADQNNTIKNKLVDFVVFRQAKGEERREIPYLEENYRFVKKVGQYRNNIYFTYYLYEVKN